MDIDDLLLLYFNLLTSFISGSSITFTICLPLPAGAWGHVPVLIGYKEDFKMLLARTVSSW